MHQDTVFERKEEKSHSYDFHFSWGSPFYKIQTPKDRQSMANVKISLFTFKTPLNSKWIINLAATLFVRRVI